MLKLLRHSIMLLSGAIFLIAANTGASQAPVFMDIARNADGSLKEMGRFDAIQYCLKQGGHLPSARELAQLAMSLGAKGFVEGKCDRADGCVQVPAANADGSSDVFNYSYVGYQTPYGDLGRILFWSSSDLLGDPVVRLVLNENSGFIETFDDYYSLNAVRCVSGR